MALLPSRWVVLAFSQRWKQTREHLRLLSQDGLLEGYLLAEGSLRGDCNPLQVILTCRALSCLRPDVVLIYGKRMMAYAARLGLLRAGRLLVCHPRGSPLMRLEPWRCSPLLAIRPRIISDSPSTSACEPQQPVSG